MFSRLSLRYKFLLILGAILASATVAYFALAIRLFDTDKQAYVFDSAGALVETLGEEVATGFLSALKTMRLAALVANHEGTDEARHDAVKALFDDDDNFVALALHKVDANGALLPAHEWLTRDAYLKDYDATADDAATAYRGVQPTAAALAADGLVFRGTTLKGAAPVLSVSVGIKDEQGHLVLCASALLRQDRRLAVFRRSSLYTTYLIDARGIVLAHTDAALVTKQENLASSPFIQNVLASKVAKGVSEYLASDGRTRMIAYKKLGVGGLVAVAEIPKDRAFLASRRLIEKSALFGVLILCLGFIVSIVFSRRLTAALQRLYLATERVARGDFQVEVQATSEDEVGALSRSFNHMTKEITRLLVETADKARMEKELETAQLVQDNFFPKGDQTFAGYEVSAYFRPASECGGDWWGRFQVGTKLVLLIGDATGHGVPAALITAAAHSCATTLARMQEKIAGVELSPSFVLEMLNAAIFHAGQGRVKMTFFVAVIDTATGAVRYANASHDLPLVGRAGDDAALEVDSFATRPDPCLGESLSTRFAEHEAGLSPGDALVLYTDGLSECRNAAGEEFGERRLVRGLKKLGQRDAAGIKSQIVADVRAFAGKDTVDDDLTLVVVRRPALAAFGTERQAG